MPFYLYECLDCKKEFEEFHSITEQLQECPLCKANGKQSSPPKRLIASGSTFILSGGGWANEGYKSSK